MLSFENFFLEKNRNPLRKQMLKDGGTISNLEYIKRQSSILPPEKEEQIKKMEELGVEPDRIEAFKQSKLKELRSDLERQFLRDKIPTGVLPVMELHGIKVYAERGLDLDLRPGKSDYNKLRNTINKLVLDYKDILPNRKPRIVIEDLRKQKDYHTMVKSGDGVPAAFYLDRIVHVDQKWIGEVEYLVHEVAHFLADQMSSQVENILKQAYRDMLNSYFQQKTPTRRQNLEGSRNAKLRERVAQKLGLPSDYSATNFDEWFAELITYWKTMPNNKQTYQFKTILKKVLTRL